MEKDPNSIEQHATGAKLDFGKPAALLCLTDFGPAIRQLIGLRIDFLTGTTRVGEACATTLLEEWTASRGISSRILLASLIAVQDQSGRLDPQCLELNSLYGIASTFSEALLAISALTAIGAAKYRPSGWKVVPNGIDRYSEACARHLLRSFIERDDPDTGATHWCCVAWNAAAVLTLQDSSSKSIKQPSAPIIATPTSGQNSPASRSQS